MSEVFANNAISKLATSIISSATTVTLTTGTGALFPAVTTASGNFFRLTLTSATAVTSSGLPVNEIVFCTNRSTDILTVTRAQEGTAAVGFSAGDIAANEITAGMMVNIYSPAADQDNAVRYALDTGVANAYAIALNPSMPTSQLGDFVIFKSAHANTGASTITINGGTIYTIVSKSGNAFTGGEIQTNGIVGAIFNGTGYNIVYSTNEATENFKAITTAGFISTGTTTCPTRATGDATTNAATTAFVANSSSITKTSTVTSDGITIYTYSQTLPSGMIMKGGIIDSTATSGTITFASPFPTAVMSISTSNVSRPGNMGIQGGIIVDAVLDTTSAMQWTSYLAQTNALTAPGLFSWSAIGY